MKESLSIEILTPLPLTSREAGDKVLRLWESLLPEYLPDKCGNWEPIDQPFDLRRRDSILDLWQWPFLTKKTKPSMYADVFMRKTGMLQHASWGLVFRFGEADVCALSRFLQVAAKELEADFACLTVLTQSEIQTGRQNGTVMALDKKATKFSFIVSSQTLQKWIPDVYWLTIFGAPYVKMFGKEKLQSAPTHKVEVLNDTTISLQLTANLEDMRSDTIRFTKTKERVKAFLNQGAFFDPNSQGTARRPEFEWK